MWTSGGIGHVHRAAGGLGGADSDELDRHDQRTGVDWQALVPPRAMHVAIDAMLKPQVGA